MNYCVKCGKPTDNGIMCEECIISDSPWLSAIKRKEKDLEEEVAKLKAKNAALQKRLKNAIELPCLVGDTIYCIHGMSNPIIKDWKVQEIIITDHDFAVICGHPETEDRTFEVSDHYKEWWFTDRVAAEARLEELKGAKNDR